MASYHCSVRTGPKGKAAAHAMYISRNGKYGASDRYEDLEAVGVGNMPAWAAHNSLHFWRAADEFERANGTAYREIEVALPRELTVEQRRDLVNAFVRDEFGDQHAYQWAIHCPKAALEKGDQPHAHIMYSQRLIDGLSRDPGHYFKRYNRKQPERGGCQKVVTGKLTERKAELVALRARWATVQNDHLARYGHAARVDHRRLEEQGIERVPEKHFGGPGVRQLSQADTDALLGRRAAERDYDNAQEALTVIDLTPALEAARQAAEDAAEQARLGAEADAEKARIHGMTQWELEADIERLQPPPLNDALDSHPALQAAQQAHDQLVAAVAQLRRRFSQARQEADDWREAHPLRTKLNDSGIKPAAFLVKQHQRQLMAQNQYRQLEPQLEPSGAALRAVCERVRSEVAKARASLDAQVAVLRQRLAEYRKINLDLLLAANGVRVIRDQLDKVWFDPKQRIFHAPPADLAVERFSHQIVSTYAYWQAERKKHLPEIHKVAYQAALTRELGACTGLFRPSLEIRTHPTIAAIARNDARMMVKQLQEARQSRHHAHTPQQQPSRPRTRKRDLDGPDFGL